MRAAEIAEKEAEHTGEFDVAESHSSWVGEHEHKVKGEECGGADGCSQQVPPVATGDRGDHKKEQADRVSREDDDVRQCVGVNVDERERD